MVWYDNNYNYKKKITIDHTEVDGDETDFPVLISVTDNDLRDELNGGHVKSASGYDIIFTNSAEDTQLKHEIELYVDTSGRLVFWVKILSLSSIADTDIYIYYGKVGVVVDPSTTDTWDSDFWGVYHLDDSAGGCVDSTVNGNDGTYQGDLPDERDEDIGYSQHFDGTGDFISLPTTIDEEELTVEQRANRDNDNSMYGFHLYDDAIDWVSMIAVTTVKYEINGEFNDVREFEPSGGVPDVGNWHSFATTWQTDDAKFILDGTPIAVDASCSPANFNTTIFRIGGRNDGVNAWEGFMDEVRVSTVRRSDNWLGTTHNTMDDPAAFMSWDVEQEKPISEVGADIYYHDGTDNIELQRDDSSPVQMYNGTSVIGLKLGATNDVNASPIHVYDGTTIKAILKMS